MISYAIFIYSGNFQRFLMIPINSRSFYLHGKENSREFGTFPETSMIIHFQYLDD